METSTHQPSQPLHYQPSPRVRAFRLVFGLLVLTLLIAVGIRP